MTVPPVEISITWSPSWTTSAPASWPRASVELNGLDAKSTPALDRVLVDARALSEAVLRHDQQIRVVPCDVGRDHLVSLAQAHAGDAGGRTAHRTRQLLVETDRLALARDHQDVVLA